MTNLPPPSPGEPADVLQAKAALAHRLAGDQQELINWLASRLAVALPNHVRIDRQGLFNMGKVRGVTVVFGDTHYDLRIEHGTLQATTGQVVGGVALNRTPLPIADWVSGVLAGLDQVAQQSVELRSSIEGLFF